MLEVPPGTLVLTHEIADFQRERPAWRLYMVFNVISGLCEALDWQNSFQIGDAYEKFCRESSWGALYFMISQTAPMSAERVALRLQAVLRFWEPLQSVRYLFKRLNAVLTLEELMIASSDWAMDAWCPMGEASVRQRLELAAERMARATREDCLEAIVRQMPRALEAARDLKHRDVLANPGLLRQHLATLDPASFERISAACTSDLLEHLYEWDHQLGVH
ncbi:MAG: hypothetical protein ACJ8AT_02360 [Hyalangium sp.]|uniref:hypothetical protein n=1 Tax=Hyalangium sp. TaxID=2028555 RepID=UPI00389A25F4